MDSRLRGNDVGAGFVPARQLRLFAAGKPRCAAADRTKTEN